MAESKDMFRYDGTLYRAEETITNFLGQTTLVGQETWNDLAKVLTKTTISGMDESSDKPTSFEALVMGQQSFVVRVEDKSKLPG